MDRFQALQVFVKVAEHGGFAAAARDMAMSPPAVTRAVCALEARLGTRLFIRTTRSVRLTPSGERLLQDGRRILIDLKEAEEAAVGSHRAPQGELRITAPVLFGRMFIAPILGDFLNQYQRVTAQTLFVDRVVSLMDEGQDVAIRIGHLPDSSLSAVQVGSVRRVTFAAPDYLERQGLPRHPDDLKNHRLVQSLAVNSSNQWAFTENGSPLSVKLDAPLRMNTNDAVIELVTRSWGISSLLSYQIAPYLVNGRLKTILSEFELPALPIHVVHQEGRMVSAKVRAFVDFKALRLRADPALNGPHVSRPEPG